jgi:hypothetical protein
MGERVERHATIRARARRVRVSFSAECWAGGVWLSSMILAFLLADAHHRRRHICSDSTSTATAACRPWNAHFQRYDHHLARRYIWGCCGCLSQRYNAASPTRILIGKATHHLTGTCRADRQHHMIATKLFVWLLCCQYREVSPSTLSSECSSHQAMPQITLRTVGASHASLAV